MKEIKLQQKRSVNTDMAIETAMSRERASERWRDGAGDREMKRRQLNIMRCAV